MNILVTGANGFIGQKVILACKTAGYNVYGTVRSAINDQKSDFLQKWTKGGPRAPKSAPRAFQESKKGA